ncbi:MAG: hypothetical protein NTW82_12735 [Bacteroidia bacterium]|nr:hypothetical protein [Bacteroidia bacterium]
MGTVISNLKARFGVDTSDFKKGLKDGDKAVDDFKGAAGATLDEFASMFGVNMGVVTDSVNTAFKSLNFLGQSLTAAKSSSEKFAIGLKVLKFALVSTGIGAIVVLLGSVIAYFQKSGEGADKFAKVLAQLKSVLNNVVERLVAFGKGIVDFFSGKFKQGVEEMGKAFKGMGDEIKEDWKAAGALADREDALEDREIALINSLEERRQKVSELRLLARESQDDRKKELDLIHQAEGLIKSVYADEISLAEEGLAIFKEKLALQTSDPTDEQRREVAELEAKISGLYRQQADELRALTREKKAAIEASEKEFEVLKKKNELEKIDIKIPDFSQVVSNALAPLGKIQEAVKSMTIGMTVNITDAVNAAFENMALGFGEIVGNLVIGDKALEESIHNERERLRIMKEELSDKSGNAFAEQLLKITEQEAKINDLLNERPNIGKMITGVFAELAINVGKIIVAMAIAKAGIEQALAIPGMWPVALAAGTALIALGTALKGSMSAPASGGGGAYANLSGSTQNYIYDTRAAAQTFKISGSVELVARGPDLAATIDLEKLRKDIIT